MTLLRESHFLPFFGHWLVYQYSVLFSTLFLYQKLTSDVLFSMVYTSPRLPAGQIKLQTSLFGPKLEISNMMSNEYKEAVLQAKEHILAGDIFQIVLSQRFERRTFADPFEVYRALRIVNPSPYMTYLQVGHLSRRLPFEGSSWS